MAVASVTTAQQAVLDIENHVRQCGGQPREWYVGIASDVRHRLFVDHNVNEKNDAWIHRDCATDTAARSVENYFHNRGYDGGPGGGDRTTRHVYAYRKTSSTRQ